MEQKKIHLQASKINKNILLNWPIGNNSLNFLKIWVQNKATKESSIDIHILSKMLWKEIGIRSFHLNELQINFQMRKDRKLKKLLSRKDHIVLFSLILMELFSYPRNWLLFWIYCIVSIGWFRNKSASRELWSTKRFSVLLLMTLFVGVFCRYFRSLRPCLIRSHHYPY